jgi:pSer/pThr/pTyr-binding forkhead associated (FHA) protein/tetratricopeptide (TPR) repeat protein
MAKLILRSDGVGKEFDLDKTGSLTVGRSPDCDIPITDSQASRRHCSVVRLQQGYEVADLGSTNGTLVNSTLVKRQKLKHGDVIRIGQVEIAFDDPSSAGAGAEPAVGYLVYAKGDKKGQRVELTEQRTTIGRKPTNSVVIEDPVSSSYHCEIVRGLNGYTIRDLGSTNGTLVNSEMITEAQLTHGARIRIGNTRFVFQDPAMAEIDLELAGAEDEDEWGMMRDIDLAAVRKRNPATIAYTLLFLAIVGAGAYFLAVAKPPVVVVEGGPPGNLHTPFSFEAAGTPEWRGGTGVTIGTSTQMKASGARSLEIRSSVPEAEAFFERIPVERAVYRLKGHVAARGAKARLGVLWVGTGLRRWSTAPATQSAGLAPVDLALSAPAWATGAIVGVRIDGEGAVYLDDVSLVKEAGEPRAQQVAIGEYRLDVTDGRAVELIYSGAAILVNGRVVARDAEGKDLDTGTIKAEKQDEEHVLITVEGASGAERAGVVFDEVEGFLRDGFRAFTPGKEKEFHPAFPDEGVLPLEGIRKLLLGRSGSRSFAVLASSEGGRLDAEARAEATRSLALLGPVTDGKFSFRLKLDLTGENQLARESIAQAMQLHNQRRLGEFLAAADAALAEYPFANPTSRKQLNELIAKVNEDYEKRRAEVENLLREYKDFKDQEDLDGAAAQLRELEQLHQVKPGEGTRGEWLATTKAEVGKLDFAAREARESKASEHTYIQANMLDAPDGRDFSAMLQFYYVAAFLPNSDKAEAARKEFAELLKKHPEVAQVLEKLGFKGTGGR